MGALGAPTLTDDETRGACESFTARRGRNFAGLPPDPFPLFFSFFPKKKEKSLLDTTSKMCELK